MMTDKEKAQNLADCRELTAGLLAAYERYQSAPTEANAAALDRARELFDEFIAYVKRRETAG